MLYGEDLAFIQAAGFGGFARAAAPEILRQLRDSGARRVVEVGCGAGPLTAILTGAGFEVVAIEPSPHLIAIARAAAPAARFINASVYEVDLPRCDAVLAIGEPLTYHDQGVDAEARVLPLFERVAASARLFIFDVIETCDPPLNARTWASGDDWAVLAETNEHGMILTRTIETFRRVGELYRRGTEVHSVHLFDGEALREQLQALGFLVESSRQYGAHPLPPRRRVFFCTKRTATRL